MVKKRFFIGFNGILLEPNFTPFILRLNRVANSGRVGKCGLLHKGEIIDIIHVTMHVDGLWRDGDVIYKISHF